MASAISRTTSSVMSVGSLEAFFGHAIHSRAVLLHPLAQHRHPPLEVAPLGVEGQDHVGEYPVARLTDFDALEREAARAR